jgi:hypothetical protein
MCVMFGGRIKIEVWGSREAVREGSLMVTRLKDALSSRSESELSV